MENEKLFRITVDEKRRPKKRITKRERKALIFDVKKRSMLQLCPGEGQAMGSLEQINLKLDTDGVPRIISTRDPNIHLVMLLS